MKIINRFYSLLALSFLFILSSCEKKETLTTYADGRAAVVSVKNASIAPTPSDSDNVVQTISWTKAVHATNIIRYTLELDSSNSFSNPKSWIFIDSQSVSMKAKEINAILIGWGTPYGTSKSIFVRVKSSFLNNNDLVISQSVSFQATAYVTPPKVTPPSSGTLFLVGDATQGGWSNPVPTPTQQFNKRDSVTYEGVFNLNGGKQYLILPVNGDWSQKFAVEDNTVTGLSSGGKFGFYSGANPTVYNSNFPGPSASGWYSILLDFQRGTFTVTPYTGVVPSNLFIVGDATPGAWNNPVPVPSQQFTQVNSCLFQLSLSLNGGKEYLLLPVNGDWSQKYAVEDKTVPGLSAGGAFGYYSGSNPTKYNSNFPSPANSGNYTISANFFSNTFSVK